MAINKRELQLSQDLMDLQSRYNELIGKYGDVVKSARFFRDESFKYQNELREAKKEVEILKETIPAAIAFVPKKKVSRAK